MKGRHSDLFTQKPVADGLIMREPKHAAQKRRLNSDCAKRYL